MNLWGKCFQIELTTDVNKFELILKSPNINGISAITTVNLPNKLT